MQFLKHLKNLVAFKCLPKNKARIVFYSEGSHDWIHFSGLINTILTLSDIDIVYLSSSHNDEGLTFQHSRFLAFEIDNRHIRNWLFQNIDTPLFVMTTPDLHNFQLKRSRYSVKYVYLQHSLVSLHMAYRHQAFDHYDVIMCAGPHHVSEIKAIESLNNTHPKIIIEHGYGRLDHLISNRKTQNRTDSKINVIIAPSWGETSIINSVGEFLVETLLFNGFIVTLRVHPQTLKLSKIYVDRILNRFEPQPDFIIETNMANTASIERADVMISDWSGAAIEFALAYHRPVIFIDTPKKINNPLYDSIPIEPFEVTSRRHLGTIISIHDIQHIHRHIQCSLTESREHLSNFCHDNIFNLGNADKVGAKSLLDMLDKELKK